MSKRKLSPHGRLWLCLAALTALRLVLAGQQLAYVWVGGAPLDDELMFRAANSISAGQWLGGYDYLTLSKAMFFPVWLALLHALHLPYLVGGAALAMACLRLRLHWTAGKALLLALSSLGSFFLILGLFLIEATVSFFSVKSIEMVNVLTYGGRQACQYPVDIYPRPLRLLFTWVAPFALCMHLPVSVILDKPLMAVPIWQVYAAPLAGFAFFAVMALVWRRAGVTHYRSTGS